MYRSAILAFQKFHFWVFLYHKKELPPLLNKSILEYPRREIIMELRAFFAILNFYDRFLKGLAEKQALPL